MKYIKLFEEFTANRVMCDSCDWSWEIEDGGKDVFLCHKCGHDNSPVLGEGKDDGMVYGIIDLLLKVDDIKNRREMAMDAIADFDAEGIEYNRQEFLDKAQVDESIEES